MRFPSSPCRRSTSDTYRATTLGNGCRRVFCRHLPTFQVWFKTLSMGQAALARDRDWPTPISSCIVLVYSANTPFNVATYETEQSSNLFATSKALGLLGCYDGTPLAFEPPLAGCTVPRGCDSDLDSALNIWSWSADKSQFSRQSAVEPSSGHRVRPCSAIGMCWGFRLMED